MTLESRHRRFLAEINVIPLVDVVLVLLVIFMVTAPMLYRGMDIKLPTSATNSNRCGRPRNDETACSIAATDAPAASAAAMAA